MLSAGCCDYADMLKLEVNLVVSKSLAKHFKDFGETCLMLLVVDIFILDMGSCYEASLDGETQKKQKTFMDQLRQIISTVVVDEIENVVHDTSDVVAADFVSNRLPPGSMWKENRTIETEDKETVKHREQQMQQRNVVFDSNSKVVLVQPDWLRVVDEVEMPSGDEMEDDDDDEDEEDEYDKDIYSDDEDEKHRKVRRRIKDAEDDGVEYCRLYTCTNNPVSEHCVEFKGKGVHKDGKDYLRFPQYLRPAMDELIQAYPKPMNILQLAKVSSTQTDLTPKELIALFEMLHEMRLIKVSK